MGRKDIITKEYMGDTEVFADVFNHIIYQGRKVIEPKNLNVDKHPLTRRFKRAEH